MDVKSKREINGELQKVRRAKKNEGEPVLRHSACGCHARAGKKTRIELYQRGGKKS